jgi:glycosyltransferase involved in cell wall biosynthesis
VTGRLRALQVITGLSPGGAEEQLRLLVPRLRARGIDCDVAAFYNLGSVAGALRAQGVHVFDLDAARFRDLRGVSRLTRLIRVGSYDVVHTHLLRAGLHGRWAARRAGVRTIVHTEHSLNRRLIEGRRRGAGFDAVYRTAERLGTVTLAVSEETARQVRAAGVPEHRIRVLPNGVEPEAYRFRPEDRARFRARYRVPAPARVVAVAGRLVAAKRFDVAVDAVAALGDVTLLVVGAGPERARLAARAAVRLPGRAVFTGELPPAGVADALHAAVAFASPSPEESFGLVVISALACGLPTVYADSPALAARDGSGRTVGELAGAIRVASEPGAFATALAAALRRAPGPGTVPEQYRIETVADRLAALYAELRPAAGAPDRKTTGAAHD